MIFKRRKPEDLVAAAITELEARKLAESYDPVSYPGMREAISGGWCAPSQALYDLPQITVTRGGLQHK